MRFLSAFITLFFLLSSTAYAEFDSYVEKPFNLRLGTYSSVEAYDDSFVDDDEFSGFAFSFGYVISDQFALKATYFSLEHNDASEITSQGYDLLAYLGTGLAKQGFKAYIGGGLFNDKQKFGSLGSVTYDGL